MKNPLKILLLLLVTAMVYGCAAAPLPDMIWPSPPEPPRIKYITDYTGAAQSSSVAKDIILGTQSASVMKKPMGVYVDPEGKIYVTDTAAANVFIIDSVTKKSTSLGAMGVKSLYKPIGVSTDSKGRIFVADSQTDVVSVFSPTGALVAKIEPDEPFKQPTGLAVDRKNNRLYVTDTHSHSIKVFDTETFKQVATVGGRGKGEGRFNFPSHITVDNDGKLYVVDTMNGRVQIFDRDGKFIRAFGQFGDAPGMFARSKGVGVDSEGHIYVVDSAFNNVQIFDQEGRALLYFSGYGTGRGQMILPAGAAVDKDDNIYVVDSWNQRVEKFEYLGAKHFERSGKPLPEYMLEEPDAEQAE